MGGRGRGLEDDEVDPDDPLARMIAVGSSSYSSSGLPNPSLLSDAELTNLPMQVAPALDAELEAFWAAHP